MLKEERFEIILNELKSAHKVSYESVAKKLDVSEDTIRRDIEILSRSGLLVKVRGGAISPASNPLSFQDRASAYAEGQGVIALKAQQLLNNVRTVFLDGGTTMLTLASNLPLKTNMRVITNNAAVIPLLANFPNIEIVVLGGIYNRNTETNVGVLTCQEVANYCADLYFMGVCSIDTQAGITASFADDGEVKRAFMKSAQKTVVLCNAEKLGTSDFFKVCDLHQVDTIITDLPSNHHRLDDYRKFDLEIL